MVISEQLTELCSESGVFRIDREGRLVSFCPKKENKAYSYFCDNRDVRYSLKRLQIPEGVRIIGNEPSSFEKNEEFRNTIVMDEITFPRSLLAIRQCAFSGSVINKLTIPPSLKQIGVASFMCALIFNLEIEKSVFGFAYKSLEINELSEIPDDTVIFGGRCFKESNVNEVRIKHKGSLSLILTGKDGDKPGSQMITETEGSILKKLMPEAKITSALV